MTGNSAWLILTINSSILANSLCDHFAIVFNNKLTIASALLLLSCIACPVNFTFIRSVSTCYHVVLDKLQWSQANYRCISLHQRAHLTAITSPARQTIVSGLLFRYSCKHTVDKSTLCSDNQCSYFKTTLSYMPKGTLNVSLQT